MKKSRHRIDNLCVCVCVSLDLALAKCEYFSQCHAISFDMIYDLEFYYVLAEHLLLTLTVFVVETRNGDDDYLLHRLQHGRLGV